MAKCNWCHQEMTDRNTVDCIANLTVEFPDGTNMPSVLYTAAHPGRCHDCNIITGNHHHPGCDMEVCPRCGGQLISCGCLDEEDEDEIDIYDDMEDLDEE